MTFSRHIAATFAWLAQGIAATALAQTAQTERPFAAPGQANPSSVTGVSGLGEVAFSLAIVLAVIFALAWILRRMRTFGRNPNAALDVLAEVQLGPKERAVLIRVGTTQMLVGVSSGGVTPLHILEKPVDIPSPPASTSSSERPTFASLLKRSLGR